MATSPLSNPKARLVFIAWGLLMTFLQAYDLRGHGWQTSLVDSGIMNFLLAMACLITNNNLRYYGPRKNQYAYILGWCLTLTGLWLFISYWILFRIFNEQAEYKRFLLQIIQVRFWIGFLVIGWMAMLSILWQNQQDQKKQEERKAEAEKLAREAELYKLHQQMQPHFLFNSLNSINALVGSRPHEARKMIQQLSDFLRGTLKKEEEQWISLANELQHLQLYLDIEQVRFGHRLSTQMTYEERCGAMRLPLMLLQPVVENAIKFGLYDTTEAVTITIQASVQENLLVITVQNPFDPRTARPRQGTGFGLSGVQRRLYLLFARNDLLETRSEVQQEGHLFTTILKIPQI